MLLCLVVCFANACCGWVVLVGVGGAGFTGKRTGWVFIILFNYYINGDHIDLYHYRYLIQLIFNSYI